MTVHETFRRLHHMPHPLVLPNAWDCASAAALVAAGFPAIGTTSLGVAATAGLVDGVGSTRDQTLALARRLATLPVPVTIDIEAGFDDPATLARELAHAGVAGINLEDSRAGTSLADPDDQADLIAAVKSAAPQLFLNARVDTYWLDIDTPATISRARRYAEAGADGVFVPGALDEPTIASLVASVPVPINLLYQPGGHTVDGLGELGVRRVSTGSLLFRAAVGAAVETALTVRHNSTLPTGIPSYAEIQDLHIQN